MSANGVGPESVDCDDSLVRLSITRFSRPSFVTLPVAERSALAETTAFPAWLGHLEAGVHTALDRHGGRIAGRVLALAVSTVIGIARAKGLLRGGEALGWTFLAGILLLLMFEQRRAGKSRTAPPLSERF